MVNGGWNLQDEFLQAMYAKAGVLIDRVFWDRRMTDHEAFIRFCKDSHNLVQFVFADGVCCGFTWLNGITGKHAFGHFCFFPDIWGKRTMDAGRLVESYWLLLSGPDGPIIDTILGMIPGFNKLAQRYAERLGWTYLGTIPEMLSNQVGGRADAVILYRSRYGQIAQRRQVSG